MFFQGLGALPWPCYIFACSFCDHHLECITLTLIRGALAPYQSLMMDFLNTTSVLFICDFMFFFSQGGLGVITKNWPVHFPGSIFQDYFLDRFSITESGASAFFVTFTIQMLPWQALKKWDWKWWKIVLEVLCIRNSTSLSNLNAPCMYVKDPSAKEEENRL